MNIRDIREIRTKLGSPSQGQLKPQPAPAFNVILYVPSHVEEIQTHDHLWRTCLAYYAAPGIMTDPGDQADLLADLPGDVASLVKVVQGVLLHVFWVKAYGMDALPPEREAEVSLRSLPAMLAQARALNPRPLIEARPLERKLIGQIRRFSTLLAGLLRAQGIPARARCGWGFYFFPGAAEPHYEDHWVVEYWHADQGRWIMVDAQLDAVTV